MLPADGWRRACRTWAGAFAEPVFGRQPQLVVPLVRNIAQGNHQVTCREMAQVLLRGGAIVRRCAGRRAEERYAIMIGVAE
ncbi:hypothetical protein [Sorangium sp. So ce861]|uniref:hypothetical protein n=1 Tax=Sorangium sp. So ce861 TaxID=3133323 RepID=UPI003F622A5E